MSKRIIIAGGGTGGHIFPAVAIANALKKEDPSVKILFVGAKGKMEMEKVPQAGFEIRGLDIAGFNRSSILKNIALPWKLVKSFFQVFSIFSSFRPDAVLGVGGYSSFPVLRFAQLKGIPSFIHESNSFAGKSNRMLGKRATKVFVATEGMQSFFPKEKLMITGNPVRPVIAEAGKISKEEALAFFGMQPGKTAVLVMGGSLGARSINQAIAERLDDLLKEKIQLIWQTGKVDAEKWQAVVKGKKDVWVNDFITRMEMAYAASDIVVSRAGAMAIAEICLVKKPVIFVPFPFAAEDHQTVNAMNLVSRQSAIMIKDADAGNKLVDAILGVYFNKNLQADLEKNISRFGVANADEIVAREVLKHISDKK